MHPTYEHEVQYATNHVLKFKQSRIPFVHPNDLLEMLHRNYIMEFCRFGWLLANFQSDLIEFNLQDDSFYQWDLSKNTFTNT